MSLVIRRSEPADYAGICAAFQSPEIVAGTLQMPYPSAEVWRERLLKNDASNVVLVALWDGRIVGTAGLHPVTNSPRRRHAATLGLSITDEFKGRGIGRKMFAALIDLADNWFDYRRLELNVFTDNQRAIDIYKGWGFRIEGTMREYAFRNGAYADSYLMARLKHEALQGGAAQHPPEN